MDKNRLNVFKEKLKSIRMESELTQRDLSDMMSKTDANKLSQLERGVREPYEHEVEEICTLFDKPKEYFFPDGIPEFKKLRDYNRSRKDVDINRPKSSKKDVKQNKSKAKLKEDVALLKQLDVDTKNHEEKMDNVSDSESIENVSDATIQGLNEESNENNEVAVEIEESSENTAEKTEDADAISEPSNEPDVVKFENIIEESDANDNDFEDDAPITPVVPKTNVNPEPSNKICRRRITISIPCGNVKNIAENITITVEEDI